MSSEREEWLSEDESNVDFCLTEDEWIPTKHDRESSDSDSQVDVHSDDADVGSIRKRKLPRDDSSLTSSSSSTLIRERVVPCNRGGSRRKKCLSQSLRNKLYFKYRSQLIFDRLVNCSTNVSLPIIVNSSKSIKNLSAASSRQGDEDDSDCSGD